jgi:carbonic anhydrase
MRKYSEFETRTQPWFDQLNFKGFNQAIPMKTLVIYCLDPRAADIPQGSPSILGMRSTPAKSFSTKLATGLVPRGPCSP